MRLSNCNTIKHTSPFFMLFKCSFKRNRCYRSNVASPCSTELLIQKYLQIPFLKTLLIALVITTSLVSSKIILADEIRVAVASNFTHAIKKLSTNFEKQTGHKITLVFGATGRHYAQIKNGAPFDAFLAADSKRPKLLEQKGLIITGSRFTYALGKLVLWSPKSRFVDSQAQVLETDNFYHIALANPKLAPYGKAAQEVLKSRQLWKRLKPKTVRGENIAQTFQFVQSGNAELGFVAFSQVKRLDHKQQGSLWFIPQSLYTPIKQQAVLLNKNPVAKSFLDYLKAVEPQNIIKSLGYEIAQRDKENVGNF